MIRYGAKDVIKWLNIFPPKVGVSNIYNPREILTAKSVHYKKYYDMIVGSYGLSIHEIFPTSTTTPSTLGAI